MTETNEASGNSSFLSIGNTSQIIAIAIAIAYVCGFIIVTAYLGSLGIKDYEAFHTQYLITGTTLLVILGLLYYFVGRHILTLDEDSANYRKLFLNHGAKGNFWALSAFIFPIAESCFLIVIATIVSTSLLFTVTSTPTIRMFVPLAIGGFFIQITLTSKAAESVGKLFFLLVEIFYLIAFIAFFYLADGILLQFLYFTLAYAVIFLVFSDTKKSLKKNQNIFLTYMIVFLLVSSSGTFGRYFYGHTRSAIGGGEPELVRVVIDESNTPMILQKELNISESLSSKLDLVAQTNSEIFLGYPLGNGNQGYKTLIRIDRKLIKAIISKDLSVIKYIKLD